MVGTLRPEVAESLGLSKDVQVAPGSGDNQMSALGSGDCSKFQDNRSKSGKGKVENPNATAKLATFFLPPASASHQIRSDV